MSGQLTIYSLSELSLFVVSIIGAVGGLCGILGKILVTSRCSSCQFCCGLIKLKNDPLDATELEIMKDKLDLESNREKEKEPIRRNSIVIERDSPKP